VSNLSQWYFVDLNEVHDNFSASVKARKEMTPLPGFLTFFKYDPQFKSKLPMYDVFPLSLCFGIDSKTGNFKGFNLHFLAPAAKNALLKQLRRILDSKTTTAVDKYRASEELLKNLYNLPPFKECVRQYRRQNIMSPQVLFIHPAEWGLVTYLPLQKIVSKVGKL